MAETSMLYRADMDPLGAFIRACVEIMPEPAAGSVVHSVTAREMYEAFSAWCDANSVKPWTEKNFRRDNAAKRNCQNR